MYGVWKLQSLRNAWLKQIVNSKFQTFQFLLKWSQIGRGGRWQERALYIPHVTREVKEAYSGNTLEKQLYVTLIGFYFCLQCTERIWTGPQPSDRGAASLLTGWSGEDQTRAVTAPS